MSIAGETLEHAIKELGFYCYGGNRQGDLYRNTAFAGYRIAVWFDASIQEKRANPPGRVGWLTVARATTPGELRNAIAQIRGGRVAC